MDLWTCIKRITTKCKIVDVSCEGNKRMKLGKKSTGIFTTAVIKIF